MSMFMENLKPTAGKLTLALLLAAGSAATADTVYAETGTPTDQPQQVQPNPSQTDTKHHHPHGHHFRGGHILTDTAELLGIEPKALVVQLKQGKTLLQIVQAQKGWSEDEYLKKLTESANRNIDQALAEGKIDKEKADKIKSKLPEKLKKVINRSWKDREPGQPTADYQNNQVNWSHLPH
ncbi:MAG: hypothetical protein KZY74_13535 [Paenibacillaceae bacterium]|uniref:Uncharacterized protein n=1 Tax=Paenibacillus mellifer TaxID=2937794 RepID=A0A9X1XZI4_9BACL|nr:hypothetical protein [Paenibacillus mellifer]MBW4840410.1 hypothetical protein [Paenibacillaceae bacterium]MCK8487636.1 hypothetical protein [Paenibacillus mellifer]